MSILLSFQVVKYLAGCGLQSCPMLLSKGYPDIGWNPCGGEKYLDFLRFAVFVNGQIFCLLRNAIFSSNAHFDPPYWGHCRLKKRREGGNILRKNSESSKIKVINIQEKNLDILSYYKDINCENKISEKNVFCGQGTTITKVVQLHHATDITGKQGMPHAHVSEEVEHGITPEPG